MGFTYSMFLLLFGYSRWEKNILMRKAFRQIFYEIFSIPQ